MNPPTTLALYAAGLVVVFVAALGLGSVVGPVGTVADAPAVEQDHGGDADRHDGASSATTGGPA